MVRFSKLPTLFTSGYCLTLGHVFASPDPTRTVNSLTSWHNVPRLLQVRAQPNDPECLVEPYDAPPVTKQTFPPYDSASADIYRYRQQQSVNLGSWFVHEKWMTPSLFSCASGSQKSEIDIAYGWWSIGNARSVLERHWDTFITETDFQYLASIGINTVRLPIGYWNLGPDFMQATAFESVAQVYRNCWPRIVRAINQAGDAGIGVLVDLHGAVGSQNGQQHSGISDGATNLFNVPSNVGKTIDVLTFLARELAAVNNVVGIQILNEPQCVDSLTDFYSRAIDAIREVSPLSKDLPLYLHDGFNLDHFSDFVSGRTDFVVQDHHSYFVFTDSDRMVRASQHTANIEGVIAWMQPPRGYIDGLTTAKVFASNNMSRLGFIGQYVMNEITKAGPSLITPGTEKDYEDAFMEGLAAGENMVLTQC